MLMQTGSWLRQQREAHGWPRREMAARIIQAARAAQYTTVPGINDVCRYIRRWEERNGQLTERYILYCCTALGIPAGQFGTAAPPQPRPQPLSASRAAAPGLPVSAAVPGLSGPRLHTTGIVTYGGSEEPGTGDFTVAREVVMAAHEASDHAEQAGQPGIGDATFEQLRADVKRLSGTADSGEPLAAFLEARRVRERIYRLLDQRLWPREQTDLYFLLGCLNGLMGISANWLGYLDSAEELHRAGWAYANAIDHRPLMARLRCELSKVAYFRGR
jgi:transcriptional regulator with XRE-family HTH domain